MKKDAVAIIPARGGSKRIPKKNIKDFFGKPLIAYSIEVALASKLFFSLYNLQLIWFTGYPTIKYCIH